jgi:hypothetical protein
LSASLPSRDTAGDDRREVVTCVVYTLDDHGLVKEVQGFLPHEEAEALEAAGLSE